MIPSSFTAFRKSLRPDDTVRIVNYLRPWHTRTTTIECLTLTGFQVVANEHGRYGGDQRSSHITWPPARFVSLVENGIEFLSDRERAIWEWSDEYGGPVRNDLVINPGEPWLRLTKVGDAQPG